MELFRGICACTLLSVDVRDGECRREGEGSMVVLWEFSGSDA